MKFELAISITLPIPVLPATISAITDPTKASVMAIFNDAKKNGSDRGIPTLMVMSRCDAPSDRITSSSSGSIVANAVAMLATIGKNDSMNAVITAGTVPAPNQMTKIGTSAAFGTLLKPTSKGYKAL